MLNNYYLLHRLSHVWAASLPGATFIDAWCHAPGEFILTLEHSGEVTGISFLTNAPIIGAFRRFQVGRPQRNTKSVLRPLRMQSITGLYVSEGDRILTLKFTGGLQLQSHLYGGRANVFLADESGEVLEALRKGGPAELPPARTASEPLALTDFPACWNDTAQDPVRALQRIFVRFNRDQAGEVLKFPEQGAASVFESAHSLHLKLLNVQGPLYLYENPFAISLIPLTARSKDNVQVFRNIDEGLHTYARLVLSDRAFRSQYEPLRKTLVRRLDRAVRSLEHMRREYSHPSRAEKYERLGHLLMASQPFSAGKSRTDLLDIFHPEETVTVTLDPALNSIKNAERYYAKARKARKAHAHLHTRIRAAEAKVAALQKELDVLMQSKTLRDLKSFQITQMPSAQSRRPFRCYVLAPSYEVWVGRNAKESEQLTFRHARSFDLWLHARGVSGAHALLRLPDRNAQPGSLLIEQAAAIAAWHSKARTSVMAPVIVTPRKYVHKVRGTPAGEVAVSREDVVVVEPALP